MHAVAPYDGNSVQQGIIGAQQGTILLGIDATVNNGSLYQCEQQQATAAMESTEYQPYILLTTSPNLLIIFNIHDFAIGIIYVLYL